MHRTIQTQFGIVLGLRRTQAGLSNLSLFTCLSSYLKKDRFHEVWVPDHPIQS